MESQKTPQRKWYLGVGPQEGEWLPRKQHSRQRAYCLKHA